MAKLCIVVDRLSDWDAFYPSDDVVSVDDYLREDPLYAESGLVINLCRDYDYQGKGYYCSLLAEARGDRVLPSVRTINALAMRSLYSLELESLDALLKKNLKYLEQEDAEHYVLWSCFGSCSVKGLQPLVQQLFEKFPCPIMEIRFRKKGELWRIEKVSAASIHHLDEAQEDVFAAALDQFSSKIWRKARGKRRFSYDLAMLVDPSEKLPPSNRKALAMFEQAGRRAGIEVSQIDRSAFARLAEYDALFIRATTGVNHYTYRFAQKAEMEHMPVVDEPDAILRCANKVYLAELMRENELPTPKTMMLCRDRTDQLAAVGDVLGFPVVLKIPDGSFSRGVHLVQNEAELRETAKMLYKRSVLILAQEFMYTEFDWRIGVLGGQPLFACRYYMCDGHWQIYNHAAQKVRARSGGFDCLAVEQAPQDLIRLAVKACGLIGEGLYGIDIKQQGDRFSVIEINDNPNIDAGIEDAHLGPVLYSRVMDHFYRLLEAERYGH